MPATTAKGLPYMVPGDPLADVAEATQNLAEATGLFGNTVLLRRAAAQVFNTNATTVLSWDTETIDEQITSWLPASPTKIKIKRAGLYELALKMNLATTAAGLVQLIANNDTSGVSEVFYRANAQSASSPLVISGRTQLVAALNDELSVGCFHTIAGNPSTHGTLIYQPQLLVRRIS